MANIRLWIASDRWGSEKMKKHPKGQAVLVFLSFLPPYIRSLIACLALHCIGCAKLLPLLCCPSAHFPCHGPFPILKDFFLPFFLSFSISFAYILILILFFFPSTLSFHSFLPLFPSTLSFHSSLPLFPSSLPFL